MYFIFMETRLNEQKAREQAQKRKQLQCSSAEERQTQREAEKMQETEGKSMINQKMSR